MWAAFCRPPEGNAAKREGARMAGAHTYQVDKRSHSVPHWLEFTRLFFNYFGNFYRGRVGQTSPGGNAAKKQKRVSTFWLLSTPGGDARILPGVTATR